ncbi:MAG: DNA mismatch repair endonuclease MutL [Lentisphaerae bacterium]|nr:DNA mismatch repair endonuclease MutL [Lentisphaerota bacterium]
MGRIKVMDQELANLIAAGEVIERPASVVKELVENSLDAGASRITVEIERAGSRLIAVTDDGCGMDEEDARNALELHGTSKLVRAEDISTIKTMGFRGEALPSMAQVSKFTMRTRCPDADEGVEVSVEGGRNLRIVPCGSPAGTCIKVEDLFFNTPARKKFMKSPGTEEHHIEEAVTLLALANPETAFELRIDRRVVFRLAKSSRNERMRELFGRQDMIELSHKEGSLRISGFTGVPGLTRSSRREQRFFVNRRPVDSLTISRALRDGYATLAEPGRYVPAVLFLELPVEDIDINVHPAKREIRFRSEFTIVRAVAAAVSNALRNWGAGQPGGGLEQSGEDIVPEEREEVVVSGDENPGAAPDLKKTAAERFSGVGFILESSLVTYSVEKKVEQPEFDFERIYHPLPDEPLADSEKGWDPPKVYRSLPDEPLMDLPNRGIVTPERVETETADSAVKDENPPSRGPALPKTEKKISGFWPEKILGIYDDTYLLASGVDGLLLIDQHAAHERVMFEKLLDSWQPGRDGLSQGLLIPETLELPRGLLALLTRNLDFFQQLGFDFVPAGRNTVMVNALPLNLKTTRPLAELVTDMLNGLLDEDYTPGDLEAVARAACHAAVRAHDPLTVQGAEKLLEELKNCRQGTLCPHGRPTIITLTLREIEKRFGRR